MGGLPEEPQVNKGKSHHPRLLGDTGDSSRVVCRTVPSSGLAVNTAVSLPWPYELMNSRLWSGAGWALEWQRLPTSLHSSFASIQGSAEAYLRAFSVQRHCGAGQ